MLRMSTNTSNTFTKLLHQLPMPSTTMMTTMMTQTAPIRQDGTATMMRSTITHGPCLPKCPSKETTCTPHNSIIPSLEVHSGSMQGPMVSSRANGVSLSSGFCSKDFGTVLEDSGISDRFRLLSSRSGGLSHGFPWSCAWSSDLAKSRDVVSHGHVFGFEFDQVT